MLFVMEASQWSTFAAVLLLLCRGLQCIPAPSSCTFPCLCPRGPLMNCSSSGLSLTTLRIPATVTDVDLSHNLLQDLRHRWPSQNLKSLWLGNNSITHLSLCADRPTRGHYFRDSGPRSHHGCVSWAPTLQLLSVERNRLEQLPEGLGSSQLEVLQLSYNKISALQPGELSYLPYLRELHLQHNSISSLLPQAFNDLPQLKVLDLSFNLLTSIAASTYINLRNLQASVELSGNRWRCDCSLRSVRRWMAYDDGRGRQTWKMVCASPSTHSGRDLRHLKEEELSCSVAEDSTGPLHDVTVDEGSEILLPCGSPPEDPTWWTPHGQVPGSRSTEGLLISDVTERDAGLYACVSGSTLDSLFLFNVQVRQKGVSLRTQGNTRGGRSLPRNGLQMNPLQDSVHKEDQLRNYTRATQSDLALAVCLSILFSFLVAFILGVVARPYLDILCGRICNKRSHSPDNTAPRAEHNQYNNEAYCEEEELEQVGRHRERRVTFSAVDYKENNSVPYYDTVGGAEEEVEGTYENLQQKESSVSSSVGQQGPGERAREEDSLSQGSSQGTQEETQSRDRDLSDMSLTETQDGTHTVPPQSIEYEHIPDPDGQEEQISLSSVSSQSSQSDKDSQSVGTTTSGVKRKAPKSPREAQSPQLEEDNFQQGSTSPIRSVVVPQISTGDVSEIPGFTSEPFADWSPNMNDPNLLDPEQWNDSGDSFEFPDSIRGESARSSSHDLSTQALGEGGSNRYLERDNNMANLLNQNHSPPPPSFILEHSDRSSSSSSIDSGPTEYTVNAEREKEEDEVKNVKLTQIFEQHSHGEHHPSDERFYQENTGQEGQSSPVESERSFSSHSSGRPESALEPEAQWPDLGLINVPKIKRRLDIKAPSPQTPSPPPFNENVERGPWSDLVSSTPKVNSETDLKLPDLSIFDVPQTKTRLDIEVTQRAPAAPLPIPTTISLTSSSESEDETTDKPQPGDEVGLPNIGNINVPQTQTGLDIKAISPPPSSPLHDLDEIELRAKHDLNSSPTQTGKTDPEASWPKLNLMNIPNLKRRLDIKAPSPPPSTPPTYDKVERRPIVDVSSLLPKVEPEPEGSWPDLDLIDVPKLKRHLDIKAPAPTYSSSSSDDETTDFTVKQKEAKVKYIAPLSEWEPKSNGSWPDLGLMNVPKIKRRLDVKALSPPPSSTPSPPPNLEEIEWRAKHDLSTGPTPPVKSDPEGSWPEVSLITIPKLKRRLDIKAPSPPPSTPPAYDKVERRPIVDLSSPLPKVEQESKGSWPDLGLINVPKLKRRLDIKAPAPTYSSSSSEDETTDFTFKQKETKAEYIAPTSEWEPKSNGSWPDLGLINVPKIKRRLDVKALSPPPSSTPSPPPNLEEIEWRAKHDLSTGPTPAVKTDPEGNWPEVCLITIPKLKRRLDIKAPSPPTSTPPTYDKVERRPIVDLSSPLPKVEQESKGSWPDLGLINVPKLKRRLDIKAPAPTYSSSSSEDETTDFTFKQKETKAEYIAPTSEWEPKSNGSWPDLGRMNVPKIKRRLDVKALSPPPASTPSPPPNMEEIEWTTKHDLSTGPTPAVKSDPEGSWPEVSLITIPKLKRRLDIKAPSPPPSTPHTYDKVERRPIVDLSSPLPKVEQESKGSWPDLGLINVPKLKRRLDIKAPAPTYSSSSSEDETTDFTFKQKETKAEYIAPTSEWEPKSNGSWPDLGRMNVPKIKRRLDVKALSPPPASTPSPPPNMEEIEWTTKHDLSTGPTPAVKSDPEGSWPEVSLITIPKLKRRLDIKAPSPPPSTPHTYDKVERRPIVDLSSPLPKVEQESKGSWPDLGLINVPKLKRRLDIKAPAPTYSSSSSEDETTDFTFKQKETKAEYIAPTSEWEPKSNGSWPDLGLINVPKIKRRLDVKALSPPPTSTPSPPPNMEKIEWRAKHDLSTGPTPAVKTDPEGNWPEVSLITIPKLKRRLDIKAPSPPTSTPPAYDKVERRPIVDLSSPLYKVEQESKGSWPDLGLINVPKLKRRLDIKAPTPTYSSSSSEDETTDFTVKQKETKAEYIAPTSEWEPKSNGSWPDLGLMNVPKIKRRLDVKALSPPPASTPSPPPNLEEIEWRTKHDLSSGPTPAVKTDPEGSWPEVSLITIPKLKRRLDIKAPSPPPSTPHPQPIVDQSSLLPKVDPEPKGSWPDMGLINVPKLKRRLDIKAPSPPTSLDGSVSSSVDSDVESTVRQESGSESKWPDMGLIAIPKLKRRLDIKAPSPPDSEITEIKTRLELSSSPLKVYKEPVRELASLGPAMPGYRTHYIRQQQPTGLHDLGTRNKIPSTTADYTLTQKKVTEVRDEYVFPKSGLDIKALSPPLDSEKIEREARLNLSNSNTPKVRPEPEAKLPDLGLFNILPLRRRLDIRGPQESPPTAPSTPTADLLLHGVDTTDLTVHGRERQGTQDFAREKASSLSLGDIHVSLAPRRALNINYDNYAEEVGRKMDLSTTTLHGSSRPEIGLSSISHHAQSTVISGDETGAGDYSPLDLYGRGVLVDTPPPQEAPPELPDAPPPDSSGDSGDDLKNETTVKYSTQSYNYSSISHAGVPLAQKRAIDIHFDNSSSSTDDLGWEVRSEGKREKQGLGALKALSSNRQQWDIAEEEKGDNLLSYQRPISSQYRDTREEDEPKLSLTKTSLLSTDPKEDKRTGSPSRVSRLRRRLVVDIQSPVELPPPAPETPPPAIRGEWETTGSRLMSPLSSETHVWGSTEPYQPSGRTLESSSLSPRSTIFREDEVDRRSSLVGLQGATPYHTARQYQSVTSTTTTQKHGPEYNERNGSFSTPSKTALLPFETNRGSISEA